MKTNKKRLNKASLSLALLALLSNSGHAGDYRGGLSLGFGGTGIQANTIVTPDGGDPQIVTARRSNGPGVVSVYFERALSNRFILGLEHFRGFKLAPFESGVHFTGVVGRYYINSIAYPILGDSDAISFQIKKYAMFVGLSTGVAIGKIETPNDLVPTVESSGIHFGGRLGADYALMPDIGLRGEVVYGLTLATSGEKPSNMLQFGIMAGAYYYF
jgi:hypothetical protein